MAGEGRGGEGRGGEGRGGEGRGGEGRGGEGRGGEGRGGEGRGGEGMNGPGTMIMAAGTYETFFVLISSTISRMVSQSGSLSSGPVALSTEKKQWPTCQSDTQWILGLHRSLI